MPEVYVHAVEGRTPAQKKALMKDITDAVVKNFGAPPEAVVVTDIWWWPSSISTTSRSWRIWLA